MASFSIIGCSYVLALFPQEFFSKMRLIEIFSNLGFFLSPIIGGVIYETINYESIFFVFAGLILMSSIFAYIYLPIEIETKKVKIEISRKKIIFNREMSSTILLLIFMNGAISFLGPTFSIHIQKYYNLNKIYLSLIFILLPFSNILTDYLINFIMKRVDRRILIMIGCFILSASFFIIVFSNNIWSYCLTLIFLGCGSAFISSPMMEELKFIANEITPNKFLQVDEMVIFSF